MSRQDETGNDSRHDTGRRRPQTTGKGNAVLDVVPQRRQGFSGRFKGRLATNDHVVAVVRGHLFGSVPFGDNFKGIAAFDRDFGPQIDRHANGVVCRYDY